MNRFLLLITILLSFSVLNAQKSVNSINPEYKLNYKDPISVVNGMIEACKKRDLKLIFLVFDPFIESGEFLKYRMVNFTKNQNAIDDMYDMRNSYINGLAQISTDEKKAIVPLLYKSTIREHQEEINLINRYGNWYIKSF